MVVFVRKYCVAVFFILALFLLSGGLAVSENAPRVGVFLNASDSQTINAFETSVGKHQDIILYFQAWADTAGQTISFDSASAQEIIDRGSTPMIGWEPWQWGKDTPDQPKYSLASIISGSHDAFIRDSARRVKNIRGTIYIRPMHEMNGNWYPWAGTVNGNRPEQYAPAYRRIVDIFRQEGATNVRWVWAPNHIGLPDWTSSSFKQYYPGDDYVDFAAIDGYNFGTSQSGMSWLSFDDIFAPAYREITGFTNKPILIAEMASAESGGDKAAWITNAFERLEAAYPRIVGLVWFNLNKEADWRIESSAASLNAYRAAMTNVSILQSDVAPPTTKVRAPLRVATEPSDRRLVQIRWSATDPSPASGIVSYKVQVRTKRGKWSTWRRATTSTAGRWLGFAGRTYYFRARAKDRAGNIGQWSIEKKTVVRRGQAI